MKSHSINHNFSSQILCSKWLWKWQITFKSIETNKQYYWVNGTTTYYVCYYTNVYVQSEIGEVMSNRFF